MKKRMYGIDLVKVWAIISVIALHQLPEINYYTTNFGSGGSMYILPMIHVLFLSCVPLFIMTTGFLLSSREISKSHCKKYLYFLIEVILIYTIGMIVYELILNRSNPFTSFKELVKTLLAPNYYVGLYTTLYFISPFLNKLFFSLTDKQKKLLLLTSIAFISLLKIQNIIPHFVYYSGWPTASYPILYYFLGLYFKHFTPKFNKLFIFVLIIATCIAYSFFMNYYMSGRTFYYILGHYEGIFTVVMSVLSFGLLYDLNILSETIRKVIVFISSSTLGFYLISTQYSDSIANSFITISSKMSQNIITIPQKLIYSSSIALPTVFIIYYLNKWIKIFINKVV